MLCCQDGLQETSLRGGGRNDQGQLGRAESFEAGRGKHCFTLDRAMLVELNVLHSIIQFEKPGRREDFDYPEMVKESGSEAFGSSIDCTELVIHFSIYGRACLHAIIPVLACCVQSFPLSLQVQERFVMSDFFPFLQ